MDPIFAVKEANAMKKGKTVRGLPETDGKKSAGTASAIGIGIAVGTGLGIAVGIAIEDIGLGLMLGICVGLCIGATIGSLGEKVKDRGQRK